MIIHSVIWLGLGVRTKRIYILIKICMARISYTHIVVEIDYHFNDITSKRRLTLDSASST